MEPQTHIAQYQCECGDDNCVMPINDEDYYWFTSRYNTDRYVIYSSLCPHISQTDAVRIRSRNVAIGTRIIGIHYVCECGKPCGLEFNPVVYLLARKNYPDIDLYSIRHPACQTSINYERVVSESKEHIVYSTNPSLKEINRITLGPVQPDGEANWAEFLAALPRYT